MKKILQMALCLFFTSFMFAQEGKIGDFDISYKTKKPLSSGMNDFVIELKKDGQRVSDAKINLKAIMPPMPGMPKMDFEAIAKESSEGYIARVSLPHGGTWQLRFQIEVEGKKYTYKSSIDF
ncbi:MULTISPECIES: FixH family protein [unclassified Helicobacter]|uniref:FixH family protein n=1 Tax=unclassified Helicobacter TaxID=2593540 RepID=UPI000CF10FC6|nr:MULTISPECIES: FixH family protein [unclassified Helicobacter]